ncbi:uncharacterized protein LOC119435132 [Dermacentor silvarum]|uniref:uncharacterized protein LOC119435132 n=1 Tax=Dermacentor silvarum TaxID=543639 RepID=UPI001898A5F1|nr:uncharacterized protein LOC119435132 [Dermacentor silvarum]
MRNAAPLFPLLLLLTVLWRIAAPLLLYALHAPLLLRLATATLLLPVHGADEAQPLGAQCSGAFECQNPEMVHCMDGICACRYGHHSPYLCKEGGRNRWMGLITLEDEGAAISKPLIVFGPGPSPDKHIVYVHAYAGKAITNLLRVFETLR